MNYEELEKEVEDIFNNEVEISDTKKIPSLNSQGLTFSNSAKKFSAAILFIDIRDSSSLPFIYNEVQITQIFNSYYSLITNVAKEYNGEIRGFHGDGIMFVFGLRINAVNAAFEMQKVINNILNRKIDKIFWSRKIECGIGIDCGEILAVKVGARGIENQGMVWPSAVTNTASKLADSAEADEIRITSSVYNVCSFINAASGSNSFNINDWQYLKDFDCYASKYIAFRFNPFRGLNFDFAKAKAEVQLKLPSLDSLSTASKLMGIPSTRFSGLAKHFAESSFNINGVPEMPSAFKPDLSALVALLPPKPIDPFTAAITSAISSGNFPLQYYPKIN